MTNELDEGLLDELAHFGLGRHDVHRAVHGKHGPHFAHLEHLGDHVLATEPRQALVPAGCQELLHTGVSYELER